MLSLRYANLTFERQWLFKENLSQIPKHFQMNGMSKMWLIASLWEACKWHLYWLFITNLLIQVLIGEMWNIWNFIGISICIIWRVTMKNISLSGLQRQLQDTYQRRRQRHTEFGKDLPEITSKLTFFSFQLCKGYSISCVILAKPIARFQTSKSCWGVNRFATRLVYKNHDF